jgi:hypothetical protein
MVTGVPDKQDAGDMLVILGPVEASAIGPVFFFELEEGGIACAPLKPTWPAPWEAAKFLRAVIYGLTGTELVLGKTA